MSLEYTECTQWKGKVYTNEYVDKTYTFPRLFQDQITRRKQRNITRYLITELHEKSLKVEILSGAFLEDYDFLWTTQAPD